MLSTPLDVLRLMSPEFEFGPPMVAVKAVSLDALMKMPLVVPVVDAVVSE